MDFRKPIVATVWTKMLIPSLLLSLLLSQGRLDAQPRPTPQEIRTNTMRYLKALQAKGRNVDVFLAKRILTYLKTNPKAALGMYLGYKPRWDKILGWGQSKSQKHLAALRAQFTRAKGLAAPANDEAFKRFHLAWARLEGEAGYHIKTFCSGRKDDTCAQAQKIRKQAAQAEVAGWEAAIQNPSITFKALQDVLLDGERNPLYAPMTHLDKWVPQLAKEKTEYWQKKLGQGLARYGKAQGGMHVCVPLSRRGRFKTQNLKYLFGRRDTAYVQCHFFKPPAKFRRAGKDYWRVSIQWAGSWEKLLVKNVRHPSRSKKLGYKVRISDLRKEIQRRARSGNLYPGNWVRVQVAYVVITIKGYRWVHGVRKPVFKHTPQTATSFFVRWR